MATQVKCYSLALVLFLTFLHVRRTCPKIVEGVINTKENWAFIATFCFKDSKGVFKYNFKYPKTFAVQNILLYFDDQWPMVFPEPEMSCRDKEDILLLRGNNQVINLTETYTWSGCKTEKENYICDGDRRFISNREKCWYIALSNCDSVKGLQLRYSLDDLGTGITNAPTNGAGAWRHFSTEERFILPMDIAFRVFFVLIAVVSA